MVTVGIDEVGRGCWAGPLVAGAVVLGEPITGLKDSKKLSRLRRESLDTEIQLMAAGYGLGWVQPDEIDALGLTASVRLAMQRALEQLTCLYDEIIIDGNLNFFADDPRCRAVIKADDSVPAVSAASIIAKVARDNFMRDIARQYPAYGFDKHVGYGTGLHLRMLKTHGVSDIHRKSFKPIQTLLGARP
ncbi:MAG TPA: ribonuclease HII [Candidatus Saccharimonadales bacterium]|nr:ribonuclease HII [Candidatus Saccharimonadales bacterium]